MPDILLIAAAICVVILVFGILKRVIMIALIIAGLVAIGAVTMHYTAGADIPKVSVIT